MKLVSDILVPLDGSEVALQSLGPATWLASRLGARLHVLNAGEALPARQALARLGVPEALRPLVEIHQSQGEAAETVLAAAETCRAGLVVMTARGESSQAPDAKAIGHVTREVIERSRRPVLVLPPSYEEAMPWRSILVPLSGERATDECLSLALRLARALELRVVAAHVAVPGGPGPAVAGSYADAAHHDAAQSLDEMVESACGPCTPEERQRISALRVPRGATAEELLRIIDDERVSLVVLGWHGAFMVGHAQILKALMRRIRCPVLLAKPEPVRPFRLKVGDAFG